jgi:hypothetical protein
MYDENTEYTSHLELLSRTVKPPKGKFVTLYA